MLPESRFTTETPFDFAHGTGGATQAATYAAPGMSPRHAAPRPRRPPVILSEAKDLSSIARGPAGTAAGPAWNKCAFAREAAHHSGLQKTRAGFNPPRVTSACRDRDGA